MREGALMTGPRPGVNACLTFGSGSDKTEARRVILSHRDGISGATQLRLIVIEDEPFIALDLETLATAAGHEVLGVADTLDDAVELARERTPEAALVDLNLRDGMTGVEISRRLSGHGVAVGFITGNAEEIPPDFGGAVAVVEKPFTPDGVHELLDLLQFTIGRGARPPTRFARRRPPVR